MSTTILFLHGALASKNQFDTLIQHLPEGLKGDAINFSGHGGTLPSPLGYHFNAFADDILKYADSQGIDKLNLFGFSMGGYAALYFAKLHPERVNKIFTVNVKFSWDADSTQKEIAMLNAENMMLKVPGFANNLMIQHGLNMWKQVLDSTADMMKKLSSTVMLTDEDYGSINCPVLLAVGDRDKTSGIEQTLDIYKKLHHAAFWVIPFTAHPFEKMDQQQLIHQINNFFSHD